MQGITYQQWFWNGYVIGLDQRLLPDSVPEPMQRGWSWGFLEGAQIFEQHRINRNPFRRMLNRVRNVFGRR